MTGTKVLNSELIGLVPAAGRASRIQPLPCSKELLPIGFQNIGRGNDTQALRPKTVSHCLLENMHRAGARKAYMILNRGKWDIPNYYGPGTMAGLDIAYVVTDYPYGAPFSVKQACPFVPGATILFGFPDIVLKQPDALSRLVECLHETGVDLVLGLFPAHNPLKMDMVNFDDQGRICAIDIKPQTTHLTYTWILAAWSPAFTNFMCSYLEGIEPILQRDFQQGQAAKKNEYYMGHVFQAALKTDIKIKHVIFGAGRYVDIGTPVDLVAAMRQMGVEKEDR